MSALDRMSEALMNDDQVLLFDAGVWIASQDREDRYYDSACELIAAPDAMPGTMDLTLFEIANGILRRWRDPKKAADMCRSAASRCREHFVSVDQWLIEATVEIAIEHRITSYDAAYVAVARRHDWTLVSTDIRDLVSQGLAITPDAAV